ncbi:MAG: hypothetical protein ACTHZX_08110 [Microbacterium sp.]
MEWMSDVSAGDWIRERVDPAGAAVPSGFEAYARVRHPVFRERPVGAGWPEPGDERAWARFVDAQPEVDTEQVTWRQAAAALGAELRPASRWADVAGSGGDVRDRDGWRYDDPEEGALDPDALAAVASLLIEHTGAPDTGCAAIWDGWDGLVGGTGASPAGPSAHDEGGSPRHAAVLRASFTDALNEPFRRRSWQQGVLSDEISRGPRLELPGRSHVLFRAAPRVWADPDWPDRVPWAEPDAPWLRSPSLVWPDDRAWILVTDPASDATAVGGSADLIRALIDDSRIEAVEVPAPS